MIKAPKVIKALAGKISTNFVEIATLFLILVGLPFVAYLYVDVKLAVAVFVTVGIIVGILSLYASVKANK